MYLFKQRSLSKYRWQHKLFSKREGNWKQIWTKQFLGGLHYAHAPCPAHTDVHYLHYLHLLHLLVQVMMQEATVEGKPGRGGCGWDEVWRWVSAYLPPYRLRLLGTWVRFANILGRYLLWNMGPLLRTDSHQVKYTSNLLEPQSNVN